jgi:hypothetical protein
LTTHTQAELDYLAMKRENKNLSEENIILQARLRQFVDHMASQVCKYCQLVT